MTPTEHRPTDSVQMTLEMDPRAITNVVTTGEALDGDVGMNRFQFPAISYYISLLEMHYNYYVTFS